MRVFRTLLVAGVMGLVAAPASQAQAADWGGYDVSGECSGGEFVVTITRTTLFVDGQSLFVEGHGFVDFQGDVGSSVQVVADDVGGSVFETEGDGLITLWFENDGGEQPFSIPFSDCEPDPITKDDCKKGGFAELGFRNQGQCIASIVANPRAGK